MKEFFGFGGYTRPAEGYFSWQHLLFVSIVMAVMTALAVLFGIRNRNKSPEEKNRALVTAALLIDGFELFKIVLLCFRHNNPLHWLNELPLFLCSIQLITIPLAAFSRGRVREAALDFVAIFGILGAVLGTYCAGNNYSTYPVLSFDNVVSAITHAISGFVSLYVMITGMARLNRKNIPITITILLFFSIAASIANIFLNCNYMFLLRGDGTPYDILYNLVGGNGLLYPLGVVALFLIYITVYYGASYFVKKKTGAPV